MSPLNSFSTSFLDSLFVTREEILQLPATLSPIEANTPLEWPNPVPQINVSAPSRTQSMNQRADHRPYNRATHSPLSRQDVANDLRDANQADASSIEDGERTCDACEATGLDRSYCNVCDCTYCSDCWKMQLPHRNNRKAFGAIPHERTRWHVANKIRGVLAPEMTEEARQRLHRKDMGTTWFGVFREAEDQPMFRDYGRYESLMAATSQYQPDLLSSNTGVRYPSLVSFVGQTGAGKSSLIKLIIDLSEGGRESFPTPVVGAAGSNVSTSEDVHLYSDPASSVSDHPALYADCEGLEGGEREPVGAKLKKAREMQARKDARNSLDPSRYLPRHISERQLSWADNPRKRSREFAVAQLYPRLLYTFSDVIVFVLKNPRVIEGVLVRLVEWAAAALEKSSNQPVLPHAIIALNATDNDAREEFWDVDMATADLMDALSQTIHHNATFQRYAKFWRERKRQINTVHDLMLSYYSSIKVIRIPTSGRPNLIQQQIVKLTSTIHGACTHARESKASLRMLLNAEELQPYLHYAFDHFACDLEKPFDFVQASFMRSPIPPDFGGNILKLAIQLMDVWKDQAKAETMFEELAVMVAGCIMLDSARHKIIGKAEKIFPQYLDHIESALENFCDRHWPCEFVHPKRGRCVNVRSGHTKGHQNKAGKIICAGDYESSFSFESYREIFEEDIYEHLDELLGPLHGNTRQGITEERAAAKLHQSKIMPHFFAHAARGSPETFTSHTVCFCCLFEIPEHILPCGHAICTVCLKTYGTIRDSDTVDIWECPIEADGRARPGPWTVRMKPASCGIRVLTLDGGGARGIIELEILKQIENALGGRIRIQSFFDLIVGTSTGGVIALGLTVRGWTVDQCISQFEMLCQRAFTPRRGSSIPVLGKLVQNYHHSMYETIPLETALMSAFTNDQYLFGGHPNDSSCFDIKVAVTAASASGPSVVFSNYNRLPDITLPYRFHRPEKPSAELKVWEAARATSAAPTYFRPLSHEQSQQTLYDGGIYHNNPARIADQERKLVWPKFGEAEPDIMVSIGTAYKPQYKDSKGPWTASPRGVLSHAKMLARLAADHIAVSLDSEQTWRDFVAIKNLTPFDKARYIRLNPLLAKDPPRMDDVSAMAELREIARIDYGESLVVKILSRRLVATSFYFQAFDSPVETRFHGPIEIHGRIRCRFADNDPRLCELGRFIRKEAHLGQDPLFVISGHDQEAAARTEIKLGSDILDAMVQNCQFRMPRIGIIRWNSTSETSISLCYTRGETFPISGFPRLLLGETHNQTERKALTTSNSFRWAGRSASQLRRAEWRPPTRRRLGHRGDLLQRFSDQRHILGNATADQLAQTSKLLSRGSTFYELEVPNRGAHEMDASGQIHELYGREWSPASPSVAELP